MTIFAHRIFRALPLCLALTACGSSPAPAPVAPAPMAAAAEPAPAPMQAHPEQSAAMADATPASAPAAEPAKPMMPALTETPSDKLGTAPAGLGLSVGTKAPDATLVDLTGKSQKLSALYAKGPTFVVFYRGGWCPFCNLQLHSLTTAKADFDRKGIRLVAISVDQPGEESKTQAKQGVPFPMLSDSTLVAHKAFNVVHVQTEAEAKGMTAYGINLETYSGQTHHSYAVASLFLVDKAGKIRWEHVDDNYTTRPTPAQMLEVADRVLAKK